MKLLSQLIISISLCVITPIVALAEIPEKDLKAANEGDAEAMFMVGSGYLLERNMPEAFSWLEKAVAKNHSAAKAALGFMYFQGFACQMDKQKARTLYEESAKEGSHQGLNNLAHLYRFGVAGIKKDTAKAEQLLRKAAELGNFSAISELGRGYFSKEFGKPRPQEGLRWLEIGIQKGVPGCFNDLGYAYQKGFGVPKDLKKALSLFEQGAKAGSMEALSNLGFAYLNGLGVEKDTKKAYQIFSKATAGGSVGAATNLAVMQYQGLGCVQNQKAAKELMTRLAKTGAIDATRILKAWEKAESVKGK